MLLFQTLRIQAASAAHNSECRSPTNLTETFAPSVALCRTFCSSSPPTPLLQFVRDNTPFRISTLLARTIWRRGETVSYNRIHES